VSRATRTLGILLAIAGVYLFFYTLPIIGLAVIIVGVVLIVRGSRRTLAAPMGEEAERNSD
jgi:uncharacterized membrane protein HdeD (DUF308 family)